MRYPPLGPRKVIVLHIITAIFSHFRNLQFILINLSGLHYNLLFIAFYPVFQIIIITMSRSK